MENIVIATVKRLGKKDWIFTYRQNKKYEFHTNKNRYVLMIDAQCVKPIWIAQVLQNDIYVTCEKQLRAYKIIFEFGEYCFY